MGRSLWAVALVGAAISDGLAVQRAGPDATAPVRSLTVFPTGGALVREVRTLALAEGMNRVSLGELPAAVDPQSFVVLASGVVLAGHRGVILSQPAGGGAQAATVAVELFAERSTSRFRFAYLTGGWSWSASYTAVVSADDRSANLMGLATVSNRSGMDLRNAEVQLLGGEIYRAPGRMEKARGLELAALPAAAEADPSLPAGTVGDYHMYTLPGRLTLASGRDRAVRLLGGQSLPAEKRYVLRQSIHYFSRARELGRTPVEVAYKIRRASKDELGDLPIPAGVVRVYRPDDEGRLQLLGATRIGNTPRGEDLWLPIGRAFEVTARRTQTDFQVRGSDRPGGRTRYESAWRIVLDNRTDRPVTVRVIERLSGDWRVLSASHKYEKRSATSLAFHVEVPAKGDATLEYRVEVER